jgi:hypothetical protein
MTRSTIRYRAAGTAAAMAFAIGAGACNLGSRSVIEPPRVTAENEHEVRGLPPDSLGGPEGKPVIVSVKPRATPFLLQPIESLSDSALVAYLDSLQYDLDTANSEIDSVSCVHRPSGAPCGVGEAARVFIEPEVGMRLWKHADIPKYGLVVGRIINYDMTDRAESTFNFPANRKVWWFVDTNPLTHRLRSRYFIRNYHATAPAVDTVGVPREFNLCNHPSGKPHDQSRAKFMDCLQSAVYPNAMRDDRVDTTGSSLALTARYIRPVASGSVVPLPPRPYVKALTDTWVTCDAGCCSTSH